MNDKKEIFEHGFLKSLMPTTLEMMEAMKDNYYLHFKNTACQALRFCIQTKNQEDFIAILKKLNYKGMPISVHGIDDVKEYDDHFEFIMKTVTVKL